MVIQPKHFVRQHLYHDLASQKVGLLFRLADYRTSSNASVMSNTSPKHGLNRGQRQLSFALRKQASFDMLGEEHIHITGTADERSTIVYRALTELSQKIRSLPSPVQQDKARSIWVRKWFVGEMSVRWLTSRLLLSYEVSQGSTVPRQALYHSYGVICREHNLRAMNSASFGKAVRSAFQGIKTRRLGVRGNR
jgi:hypothetical protein